MANPACIFHHPFPVEPGGKSGSSVRPFQMLRAFGELGYEVTAVTGFARERREQIRRLSADIAKGKHFDFAYSESHTLPMFLTEPHHLPSHPYVDHALFGRLNRKRIPLGLFYRDVYWRFDQFKMQYSWPKQHFATYFYRREWNEYTNVVDHLFLPSLAMVAALPTPWPAERLSPLPPGSNSSVAIQRSAPSTSSTLQLLYVGGVNPPIYDLTPLFESIHRYHSAQLTLCCRREEWDAVANYYAPTDTVNIVHASGEQLNALYQQADLITILRKPHPYLEFAMPVKVFEAISYGLPIVSLEGSETARFIDQEEIGWVVESPGDFRLLLDSLLANPKKLETAYQKVASVQERHTWNARAHQVTKTLTGMKP